MVICCQDEQLHYHSAPSAEAWRRGATAALADLQQRATPARQRLVERIAAIDRPFTAEELVATFVTQAGVTGRATVYRTLDGLRASGWISRIQHDETHVTYTRTLPGHHHTVICRGCGAALLLGGCDLDALLAPVLFGSGFVVEGHHLELYGRCAQCYAQSRPQ
jgi:Fur family transcriptional regulator, ferric uptake regulator